MTDAAPKQPGRFARLVEGLGLHRRELRAWAMYDWANSAFITVVVTAVWPIYYNAIHGDDAGAAATTHHAWATTGALSLVAITAPILGAFADHAPLKKKLLGVFLALGATSTALMALVGDGDWLLGGVLFFLASLGASWSFVFYDALLPHIASDSEMDRVSVAGYAIGYVGGGLLLVALLVIILNPELVGLADQGQASRVSFVVVAVWWVFFSIPLFRRVPEPKITATGVHAGDLLTRSFRGLKNTFSELRKFRQAMLFLFAFLLYNDGIGTIIRMATIYGSQEKHFPTSTLITAIVIVQFVGIPCTFLFGGLAGRVGTRVAIYAGLVIYSCVSILGYFMSEEWHFYLLAGMVGLVQGGVQALSRSMFANMIPRAKSSEFFGLFAVFERFAGIFGPLIFGVVVASTGSSQNAILAVILFFIAGGALFSRVDIAEGQRAAREANAAAEGTAAPGT